jgi:hypothetical protein
MIFFMVENKLFILNMKSQPSLDIGIVNNSDNNDVVITGNNNNNNDGNKNTKKSKHKYVKVLVDDPFNNLSGRRPMVAITCYAGSTSVGLSPKHNNSFSSGHKNTHRLYSTMAGRLNMNVGSSSSKLHPYFVTGLGPPLCFAKGGGANRPPLPTGGGAGFLDGEGCFSISITSHNKTQTG